MFSFLKERIHQAEGADPESESRGLVGFRGPFLYDLKSPIIYCDIKSLTRGDIRIRGPFLYEGRN